MDLADKVVVVTGGYGFLGHHVCKALARRRLVVVPLRPDCARGLTGECGRGTVYIFRSTDYDLTSEARVHDLYRDSRAQVVIHLAAMVGGIGINRRKPGTFYYKNLLMGAFMLEGARVHKVDKVVTVGTVCSYPKHTPVPFSEGDFWNGYPEETNAPYGIAKKALLVQAQAYRQEFGLDTVYLVPANLYGPYDNFDPESSHVIPALIKKCIDARDNRDGSITCWGTGTATREFLYVEDAAEAIIMAAERYSGPEPVNIGTGQEVSIRELAEMIARMTRFTGTIRWDPSHPDGQPRRCLDTSRARSFGFVAKTSLEEGLAKTIEWYERIREC